MNLYKYTEIGHEYLEGILVNYTITTVIFKNKSDSIDFAYTNYIQHLDNYSNVEDTENIEYNSEGLYNIFYVDNDTGIEYDFNIIIEEIKFDLDSEIVYSTSYTYQNDDENSEESEESEESDEDLSE